MATTAPLLLHTILALVLLATTTLAQDDASVLRFTGLPTNVVGGERYTITWLPVDIAVAIDLYDAPNSSGNLVEGLTICASQGRYTWDTSEVIPNGTYYLALTRCSGADGVSWSQGITFATEGAPAGPISNNSPSETVSASTPGATGGTGTGTGEGVGAGAESGSGGGGLSTAAKVGLGVGIGLGVPLLALAAILGFFLGRRKSRKTTPAAGGPEPSSPTQYYGKTQEATGGNTGGAPTGFPVTNTQPATAQAAIPHQQNAQAQGWTGTGQQGIGQGGYQNQTTTTTTSSTGYSGYGNHELDAGYQGHTELSTQR